MEKNARKKTRRTVKQDKQGKVVGYPLFVRPDREILKKNTARCTILVHYF